jgi:hypothetical protein
MNATPTRPSTVNSVHKVRNSDKYYQYVLKVQ